MTLHVAYTMLPSGRRSPFWHADVSLTQLIRLDAGGIVVSCPRHKDTVDYCSFITTTGTVRLAPDHSDSTDT
jgi:hypothetical protein